MKTEALSGTILFNSQVNYVVVWFDVEDIFWKLNLTAGYFTFII
jgi:hypothetical protein